MPVTNDITQTNPVVDADFDTWGAKQNNFFDQVRSTVAQLVTAVNGLLTDIAARVSKTGDTMTGDLVLADVGQSNALSAGFRGVPVVNIDVDATLALSHAGKKVRLFGSNPRTLTIPPIGTVGFPVGTTIVLRNSAGVAWTVARGAGVTLTVIGNSIDADRTVAGRGQAVLEHEFSNVWTIQGTGVS